MTEEASYLLLLDTLHPLGLCCPQGHSLPASQQPYRHTRAPVVDYRCKQCKKVFNLFTGTAWSGTHYSCAQIVLIIDGFDKGMPIKRLARELGLDYSTLLTHQYKVQAANFSKKPLSLVEELKEELNREKDLASAAEARAIAAERKLRNMADKLQKAEQSFAKKINVTNELADDYRALFLQMVAEQKLRKPTNSNADILELLEKLENYDEMEKPMKKYLLRKCDNDFLRAHYFLLEIGLVDKL